MIAPTILPSVLVVDDESGILDSLNILLRNEGFAPHLAHGGKAGLERIAEMSPDIVLTDIRMPNVSGVEILAAALKSTSAQPSLVSCSIRVRPRQRMKQPVRVSAAFRARSRRKFYARSTSKQARSSGSCRRSDRGASAAA